MEELLCTKLRIALNDQVEVENGFVEKSINDSETMKRNGVSLFILFLNIFLLILDFCWPIVGVWADHIQVVKLSKYLGVQLLIVRIDDANLVCDVEKELLQPDVNYVIGKPSQQFPDPIMIHYVPNLHYELLRPKSWNPPSVHTLYQVS